MVYFQCSQTIVPCCRYHRFESGQVSTDDFTCWDFGTGTCTPLREIPNLEKYSHLIKDINSTNFAERYLQYWEELGHNVSGQWFKDRIQQIQQRELEINSISEPSDITAIILLAVIFIIFSSLILYAICPALCFWCTFYGSEYNRHHSIVGVAINPVNIWAYNTYARALDTFIPEPSHDWIILIALLLVLVTFYF